MGLYPDIPYKDRLVAMRKALDAGEDKTISTDSLIKFVECVLKSNIFKYNTTLYKQLRWTAIGTKMGPSYAVVFMDNSEETLLKDSDKKTLVWWRYMNGICLLCHATWRDRT